MTRPESPISEVVAVWTPSKTESLECDLVCCSDLVGGLGFVCRSDLVGGLGFGGGEGSGGGARRVEIRVWSC
jgi:hypothetical protein